MLAMAEWSACSRGFDPDRTIFRLLSAPAGAAFTLNFPPDKAIGLDGTFEDANHIAFLKTSCCWGAERWLFAAAQGRSGCIDNLGIPTNPQSQSRSCWRECCRREDRCVSAYRC